MKAFLAILIFIFSLFSSAYGAEFIDRTEDALWVPTTFVGYDSRTPIYTVGPIYNEVSNACYLVNAQYEISNVNTRHNIMVGQTIIRTSQKDDTRGVRVIPATTTNVDRNRHHERWNGSFVDCPPPGVWYYRLNVYSGLRKTIPVSIRVEQGYGFLQVFQLAR